MWNYADKQLKNFDKQYSKINRKTMDEFQNIFNGVKDLDKNATKTDLEAFKREIDSKYDYLSDYGKYKARKYLKKRRVLYSDILLFSIFMTYAYEQYMLLPLEEIVFKNTAINTFNKETDKLKKKVKLNPSSLVDKLLKENNSKGYTWQTYNDTMTEYNSQELYRQVLQNIRENKPLNVNNKEFQKIFQKQHKRLINVNGDKISGALDNETIGIANSVKLETYSILGVEKCKFIAVEDKVTTKMCRSLDGQIFNVHDWNRFKRYSSINEATQTYNVYGMVLGVNLPPIDDHYHACRSTITYQVDNERD